MKFDGDDESFNANAVLSVCLEHAAHPHAGVFFEVGVWKDDSRIFAAEFQDRRGKIDCCSLCHLQDKIRISKLSSVIRKFAYLLSDRF